MLDAYVEWYLTTDRPFRWSYRPKSWRMDDPRAAAPSSSPSVTRRTRAAKMFDRNAGDVL